MRGTARPEHLADDGRRRSAGRRAVVLRDGVLGAANGAAVGITIGLVASSSLAVFAIACTGAGAVAGAGLGLILEAVGATDRP
jgi:hypothetical protein